MTEQELPLDTLPDTVGDLASAIPAVSARLTSLSLERLLDPAFGFADTLFLRNLSFQWQLELTRRNDKKIFFFFRRKGSTRTTLKTAISLSVLPLATPLERPEARDQIAFFRLRLPPFLWLNPPQEIVEQYGPKKSTTDDTSLLRLGKSGARILAARVDDDLDDFVLRYQRGEEFPKNGKYPVEPFLDLATTLGDWLRGGAVDGVETPFQPRPGAPESDLRKVLLAIIDAYRRGEAALRLAEPPSLGELEPWLGTRYRIAEYDAELHIRLTDTGGIAWTDEDDPFLLTVRMEIMSERSGTGLRMIVGPPDFLVSGPLCESFLRALSTPKGEADEAVDDEFDDAKAEDTVLSKLKREIRRKLDIDDAPVEEIPELLRRRGFLFRAKREGANDFEMFVLPFLPDGPKKLPTPLFFSAKFRVDTNPEDPLVTWKGGFELRFPRNREKMETGRAGFGAVKFFVRLVNQIHRWKGVLQ